MWQTEKFGLPGFSTRWAVVFVVLALSALGLILRIIWLTELPSGLHGDEAILGMEAQRVLREGWIGPYSLSALGQPAGPFYPAAISLFLFGNTILAVRMFAAVVGTITIPALFLVVRNRLGTSVGFLASLLLAVMGWHIFYSRIGFPLITWPLWVLLTIGVIDIAARKMNPAWWIAAGAMTGLGIYTYNAHPLILAATWAFVFVWLLVQRNCTLPGRAILLSGYFLASLVALGPMIHYAVQNPGRYFGRFRGETVQAGAGIDGAGGLFERVQFLAGDYVQFWQRLCCAPVRDTTDGSGVTEMVPLIFLIFAAGGIILGFLRYRSPLVYLGTVIVLVTPFSAVLTEGAEMRRTFVMAPILCVFAALAVIDIVRQIAESRAPWLRTPAVLLLATALGLGALTDLRNYFVVWNDSGHQRWVFVEPYTRASLAMAELPDDTYVYMLADRWSINYETRRFLAPEVNGEDRSARFGNYPDDEPEIDLTVDVEVGNPVFVLVGTYRDELERLQGIYPDGQILHGEGEDNPAFFMFQPFPAGGN